MAISHIRAHERKESVENCREKFENKNMKNIIMTVMAMITTSGFGQQAALIQPIDPTDKVDIQWKLSAEKWAKSMPTQIDSITRVDGVMAGHRQLIFDYTIAVPPGGSFDNALPKLRKQAQNDYDSDVLPLVRADKIMVIKRYFDPEHHYLGEVSVGGK